MPSQLGSTVGGIGGAALGNALLPGFGGIAGGFLGSKLGGLLGGGRAARTPADAARDRLKALTASLTAKAALPLTETEGYRARIGGARDAAREDADADAARAATLGLSGGTAIAAGAGARARALAGVERTATVDAESERARLQSVAASLLGQEVQMDESERARRAAGRSNMFGTLATLAGTGLDAYLGLKGGGAKVTPRA